MTINKDELNFLGFQQVKDGGQHDQRITLVKFAIDSRTPLEKKIQTHEETYSISCRAKRGEVPIDIFLLGRK